MIRTGRKREKGEKEKRVGKDREGCREKWGKGRKKKRMCVRERARGEKERVRERARQCERESKRKREGGESGEGARKREKYLFPCKLNCFISICI